MGTIDTADSGDKWDRRRSARRASTEPEAPVRMMARPAELTVAFWIWLVVGVVSVIGLIGIPILIAAFHLKAGFRGARVFLSVVGFVPALVVLYGVPSAIAYATGEYPVWAVLLAVLAALPSVAAGVLMWLPVSSRFFREVNSG